MIQSGFYILSANNLKSFMDKCCWVVWGPFADRVCNSMLCLLAVTLTGDLKMVSESVNIFTSIRVHTKPISNCGWRVRPVQRENK